MIKIAVIDDEPEIAEHIAEITKIRAEQLGIPVNITIILSIGISLVLKGGECYEKKDVRSSCKSD